MRIVLAVDGSPYSRWAVDLLLKLPFAKEPQIDVVHVVETSVLTSPLIAPPLAEQYRIAMLREMDKRLRAADRLTAQVCRRIHRQWKKVRPVVEKGRVAEKIIALAGERKANLIVLGSRGLSNIQRFLLGSTSQKVVTYAPCPVLVVKRKVQGVKEFLLAADGSESSQAAMKFLRSHFLPGKLRGTVLYVWDYPIHPHPEGLLVQMVRERYGVPLRRSGFKATTQWVMGHPAAKIVKMAAQKNADLVIVGSRGLTGVRKFLLGGISQKVVKYSHESVLVVR